MFRRVLVLLFIILMQNLSAQEEIWIKPNRGQWHNNISYKILVPGGDMYLEKTGFTYFLHNASEIYGHAHGEHENCSHGSNEANEFEGQTVKTTFINSNPNPSFNELKPSEHYENYFLGNDPNKWVSNLNLYNEIQYVNIYNNINLNLYQNNSTLKYDYIVNPGGDPYQIKVKYEGQNELKIVDEDLHIITNFGKIVESKLFAYQLVNGFKKKVSCSFVLTDNVLSFEFPEGYDETLPLVIDPELAFSTFTGSTSDNWGMTACPDINGRLIAAGIVFNTGYPTTSGVYDGTFNGGSVDVGLTKFNVNGSGLIYSTYIGGNRAETPHSIVVNSANELYIMGATSSTNFPLSADAYQNTHNGGPTIDVNGIQFNGGVDIFIFKLSANGSALIGSTYLGGSGTDGISIGNNDIAYNYGDQLRGEIIVDDASNVFISTTTKSNNFPIVSGFGATLQGAQDAVICKLSPNLNNLLWSSYIGGTGWESGNSIQLASNGDIYAVGGTTSNNFPFTAGQLNPTFMGGTVDGYVIKLTAPLYNAPRSTYLGTNQYDQAYFVQLDIDDFVYVYGQSQGNYPVTAGKYANANSGQFIHKLNSNLTASQWSSVFGAGTGSVEISPTAFLVSDCYEIYIAGWGGNTNSFPSSTTNGLPVTSDAYQSTTNGSNFYMALFTQEMLALKYATFFGNLASSPLSGDHVDGGTSRFDKSGKVYHAVCAACGGADNGFPTTSGVYSPTNNSNNCNMAAFVFELSKITATLSTGTPITCMPNPTLFENNSENGNVYEWHFGDGATSTAFQPSHTYTAPGEYTVMLIVSDNSGCYEPDTAYIDVLIVSPEYDAWALTDTVCPGETVQLFATGGNIYVWGPANILDDPYSATPIATINGETELTVLIENECGSTTLTVTVYVFGADASATGDTAICVGGYAQLGAAGGDTYNWSPPENLDNPNIANPLANPGITTYYIVEITTPEGCLIVDTTRVQVDHDIPYPVLIDEVNICKGSSIQIIAGGATSYIWSPDYNISSTTIYNPYVNPEVDTSYSVIFTNACGSSYDTVKVNVIEVFGEINPDTIICPGGSANLWATGGVTYEWFPKTYLTKPYESQTIARPPKPKEYTVLIKDDFGCSISLTTFVDIFPEPSITVSPDIYAIQGDTVQIWADGVGNILWTPPVYITCTTCPTTYVFPPSKTIYTATLTDVNTCQVSDVVTVFFDPLIFVPNVFTPDGDQFNNIFYAIANNINEFEMMIFNRWGELIFISNSIDKGWDGTYSGSFCLDDVYVWKIKYQDLEGINGELVGHVTLLR